MSIEDGGPAFPCGVDAVGIDREGKEISDYPSNAESLRPIHKGITVRDWFAGQALAGTLAYPGDAQCGSCHNNSTPGAVARNAYHYADAMLQARKEKL